MEVKITKPHLHGDNGGVSEKLLRAFAGECPPPGSDEHPLRGEVGGGHTEGRESRGDGLNSVGEREEEREGELQDGPEGQKGKRGHGIKER